MEFLTLKCLYVADSQKVQQRLFGLYDPTILLLGKPFGHKKKEKKNRNKMSYKLDIN